MMTRRFSLATTAAVLMAVAVGCGQSNEPLAPTPAPAATGAAADGSTLKATAPVLLEPVGGVRTETRRPELVFGNSSGLFTDATFEYRIELQNANGSLTTPSVRLPAGSNGQTRWMVPLPLETDTSYQWRARAELSGAFGPWSELGDFITIDYTGLVPRPPGGVWPRVGPAVVAYISASFPRFLEAVGTLQHREENLDFLRDRIIEAGICGGLDLARNRKVSGELSHDAFAWRIDGDIEVIDFAVASTDHTSAIELSWSITEGPAGYSPLPNHPGC
jgi:hypothetical protein